MEKKYHQQVYSGVLGKLLGVYLGRPVEGWEYEDILTTFGDVYTYKNHYTGAPLIVPDDDISGTFVFCRSLRDFGYKKIKSEQIGETWLNYIIENKTILWWGGLSRSTEHTAFLRLKEGIKAPLSGSKELNGKTISEQIGSQIFIDTWALMFPNDPEKTAYFSREAAQVSHDGIAVEAAVFLAVMESLAFEENQLDKLIKQALFYVSDELKELVETISDVCEKAKDWREVRQWISLYHGYDKYPGGCPMVTNHLVVLMSLLMAGDDFHQSIMIATSAGWDTDCNAGNVGCLNAIRLGLDAFKDVGNLRQLVSDRMYVVSSDGGSCITDAVIESRQLIADSCLYTGGSYEKPTERYAFEFPGSVQGFMPIKLNKFSQALTKISNTNESSQKNGLKLSFEDLGRGSAASFGIDTFIDLTPKGKEGTSYFDVICSPILYGSQPYYYEIEVDQEGLMIQHFYHYFDENDELACYMEAELELHKGTNIIQSIAPDFGGRPIYQLGFAISSTKTCSGDVVIRQLSLDQEPHHYELLSSREMTKSLTPWTTNTSWLNMFVSSAENFAPDYQHTVAISHKEKNGVVTIGNSKWRNYSVSSNVVLGCQKRAGLVGRAQGHRRYYAGVLQDGKACILLMLNGEEVVLSAKPFDYQLEKSYQLELSFFQNQINFLIDGIKVVEAKDKTLSEGGCGFLVDCGLIQAEGLLIKKTEGD